MPACRSSAAAVRSVNRCDRCVSMKLSAVSRPIESATARLAQNFRRAAGCTARSASRRLPFCDRPVPAGIHHHRAADAEVCPKHASDSTIDRLPPTKTDNSTSCDRPAKFSVKHLRRQNQRHQRAYVGVTCGPIRRRISQPDPSLPLRRQRPPAGGDDHSPIATRHRHAGSGKSGRPRREG